MLSRSSLVLHNITRGIFEAIVEQAPFAIEDLMNELDAREEEDGVSEDDEREQDVLSKEPGEGRVSAAAVRAPLLARRALVLAASLRSLLVWSPCPRPAPGLCPRPGSQGVSSPSWASPPGLLFSGCRPDSLAPFSPTVPPRCLCPAHPSSLVPTLHHRAHLDLPAPTLSPSLGCSTRYLTFWHKSLKIT